MYRMFNIRCGLRTDRDSDCSWTAQVSRSVFQELLSIPGEVQPAHIQTCSAGDIVGLQHSSMSKGRFRSALISCGTMILLSIQRFFVLWDHVLASVNGINSELICVCGEQMINPGTDYITQHNIIFWICNLQTASAFKAKRERQFEIIISQQFVLYSCSTWLTC